MAILEEQFTETLDAGAPDITYEGSEGREQQIAQALWDKLPPQVRMQFGSFQQFFSSGAWKKVLEMLQQQMQGREGQQEVQDPRLQQEGQAVQEQGMMDQGIGGLMPQAQPMGMAYGGTPGADGRQAYGIGSWFQKKIMDPIKKNPLISAAVLGAGSSLLPFGPTSGWIGEALKGVKGKGIGSALGSIMKKPEWMIPAASLVAGAFAKPQEQLGGGAMSRGAGINLQDVAKLANITDEQQGQAIGLNFLPEASARKYSPEEMALTYSQAGKAQGGRIGAIEGGLLKKSIPKQHSTGKDGDYDYGDESLLSFPPTWIVPGYISAILGANYRSKKALKGDPKSPRGMRRTKKQEGGLMSLGGNEMDLRGGGFVPLGEQEKADDVPARLSKNEFVFTADAVRAAGGGNVDAGADKMYNTMKQLEGRVG